MKLEELYKLKIAALLHDPPCKPFVILKHKEEAKSLVAKLFGSEVVCLIDDRRVKLADKVASSFDRWVLGILMGEEYIPGLFKCDTVKIKNIVMPFFEKDFSKEGLNWEEYSHLYNDYITKLQSIISIPSEWRVEYHLLYLLYESLWILKGLPCGPADTRVPTHSVFDHDYATAAMINWTFSDKGCIEGLLVGLDVAGVQDFIAASRKVRDAWISSYIVSALIWYVIIDLVDKLGPDIVIMPSFRMNVFYLYWLKNKIKDVLQYKELNKLLESIEKLFYISDKVLDMFRDLGIPPYPIIPGRATLVLPPMGLLNRLLNIRDLKEYFNNRFREGWGLLWEAIKKIALKQERGSLIWSFIRKVLDYYENYLKDAGFDENPPLALRVEYVGVNTDGADENLWSLYDEKYCELTSRLSLAKYRREEPETKLRLYSVTKQVFEGEPLGFPKPSGRGFDYCTLCGKLPAIVVLPTDSENPEEDEYGFLLYCTVIKNEDPKLCLEKFERRKEHEALIKEFRDWLNKHRAEIEDFKSIFSPGERLCPWCFLKRVLSLEPRVLKVLLIGANKNEVNEVVDEIVKEAKRKYVWFPSLAHIASARLYEKIANLRPSEFQKLVIDELPKLIVNLPSHEFKKLYKPLGERRPSWTWQFAKKIHSIMNKKVSNLDVSSDYKDLAGLSVAALVQVDPESLWFNPEKRSAWSEVFRKFNLSKWVWRYYALIRADGDSIGDLLEGKLTVFLTGRVDKYVYDKIMTGMQVEEYEKEELSKLLSEYILSSCEGDLKEFMKFCMSIAWEKTTSNSIEKDKEKWAQIIANEGNIEIDKAHKRIDKVVAVLKEVINRTKIIVSPSYHVAISAALMRIATLDVAIISELDGVTIYSGGDDLMALVPVDKALDAVFNSRRVFAGVPICVRVGGRGVKLGLEDGFLKINYLYLPLLPGVGRSYCIYIAHYHYPLSVVSMRSLALLDESKEVFFVEYFDYKHQYFIKTSKDMLVVAYNPRTAKEEYVLIPLTLERPMISRGDFLRVAISLILAKLLLKLTDEKFSNKKQIKLSHSLLYDVKESYYVRTLIALISEVEEDPTKADKISELTRKLIQEIIARNVKSRIETERLSENLSKCFENNIPILSMVCESDARKKEKKMHPTVLNIIDVARLIRSGAR